MYQWKIERMRFRIDIRIDEYSIAFSLCVPFHQINGIN